MNAPAPAAPAFRARNLLGVLSFLMRYRGSVALAVGLLLFNIALEMTLPQVSGVAINELQKAMATKQPFNPWWYAGAFVGLALVRAGVGFALGRVRNKLVQSTLKDIRAAYFDAVQRLSFAYHDKTNTGELISRGTADISRLQEFLFACLFLGIDIFFALLITMILITITNPVVGVATICTLVPTVGLIVYFARQLYPQWRKVHDLHGEMTTVIQENIAGVRVVKAFAREPDEISKFRSRRDQFVGTVLATVNAWANRVPLRAIHLRPERSARPLDRWQRGHRGHNEGRRPRQDRLLHHGPRQSHGRHRSIRQRPPERQRQLGARHGSPRASAENPQRHAPAQHPGRRRRRLRQGHLRLPGRRQGRAARRLLRGENGPDHRRRRPRPARAKARSCTSSPAFNDPTSGAIRIDGFDIASSISSNCAAPSHDFSGDGFVQRHPSRTTSPTAGPTPRRSSRRRRARPTRMTSSPSSRTATRPSSANAAVSLSGGQKQRLAIARAFPARPAHPHP